MMLSVLLLLAGCARPPSSIPNSPGTLTADNVDEVMTAAVPDAPYLVWVLLLNLAGDQYRDCPRVVTTSSGYQFTGGGCTDSAGVQWNGSATLSEGSSGSSTILLSDFGYTGVVSGGWTAKGQILVSRNADYSGYRLDNRFALTSAAPDSGSAALDYWFDTVVSYTDDFSDYVYADNWSGKIGVGAIGMFDIRGARTEVAAVSGCVYGGAGFGRIVVAGSNEADYDFHSEAEAASAPPPAYETGFPIDTGDTADTADTADTGDTADTADSGGDSGVDTDTSGSDGETLCGCAQVDLPADGGTVSTCLLPSRSVGWPLVSVY